MNPSEFFYGREPWLEVYTAPGPRGGGDDVVLRLDGTYAQASVPIWPMPSLCGFERLASPLAGSVHSTGGQSK